MGIEGLDDILAGGLPRHCLYLVEGDPGVGKTTLGLQFLLQGVREGETVLYITLSETKEELAHVARSHGWSLERVTLFELSAIESQLQSAGSGTFFHPSEVELTETTQTLMKEIDRVGPSRVVFDSLSEMRLLSETPLRHRRQILGLKQFFAKRKCTVLLLDDRPGLENDQQVESLAHGVLQLEKMAPEYGVTRRRINVSKIRGLQYREGYHDFVIRKGGMKFFPRLIAAEHHATFKPEMMTSGVKQFDLMLGGGLDRGTTAILMGPAGSGKSTIALQFAYAAAMRGEPAAIFLFDEGLGTLEARAKSIGFDLPPLLKSGILHLQQIDPAELSPGEFAHVVRDRVETGKARVIVVDSLNGYMQAMPAEKYLHLQFHELAAYLNQLGVVTITILAQHGLLGQMTSQADLSYLADSVLLLRYFELAGEVKQCISVVKRRSGLHERSIREFRLSSQGLTVGEPLREFQGVLTGVPNYLGGRLNPVGK